MYRTAIIGHLEFQSHALAREVQRRQDRVQSLLFFNLEPDALASRISLECDLERFGPGLELGEPGALLVLQAQDFFTDMDPDLDLLLRHGEPARNIVVLVEPRHDFGRMDGLMWRKLFERIVVDVFVADWDFLPRVLHVDFPEFEAIVYNFLRKGGQRAQTAVVWRRWLGLGKRLHSWAVDMPLLENKVE